VTCAEIQELLVITGSDHELPVPCLRLKGIHSGKESDQSIQSAYSTSQWKLNLMASENGKNTKRCSGRTIAKAAIALEKLIREVKQNRISTKCLPVEALKGKLMTKSERAKSAEIKGFVQRCVEMI
ncbi:19261_t:CDS:2, partial [Gigaspora margarita]